MNIFKFEMKALFKSTLYWTISLVAVTFLFLCLYPAFSVNADVVRELFKGFPPGVLAAFGLDLNIFFSISGFYSFLFIYVMLIGGIQAIQYGLGVFSKESRMKTADFLMTKPVKRLTIVLAKLSAVLLNLVFTNAIFILFANFAISIIADSDYSVITVNLQSLSLFFVQLIFMSIGIFYAVYAKRVKSVISISFSTVFGFFAISMLGAVIGDDKVRYLSPFKYFEPEYLIIHESYETKFLWITLLWVLVGVGFATWHFIHKEIRIN